MSRYRFDPQAFLLSSHDMDGIEFAVLDTLQYGLVETPRRRIAWYIVRKPFGASLTKPSRRSSVK